ncbi:hypothetical protein MIMGU_mgv1a024871mg, partial [Erythranthe guttata]
MCDGWSTKNKHPIINRMIYYSEASNKADGTRLMLEMPHIFWPPCAAHCVDLEDIEKAKKITSCIYNNDKIVNLMKSYTKDRELLRPGITRFATLFISIESLVRHSMELKRMCTTPERVSSIILDNKIWKKACEVCLVMEPLVKVLKLVDQDKKPTLAIVYEAMDRAKPGIKGVVKDWQTYWTVIDKRWYKMLLKHLHAAAYFLNPILQYSGTCNYTDELRQGLKAVIKRPDPDINAQS